MEVGDTRLDKVVFACEYALLAEKQITKISGNKIFWGVMMFNFLEKEIKPKNSIPW